MFAKKDQAVITTWVNSPTPDKYKVYCGMAVAWAASYRMRGLPGPLLLYDLSTVENPDFAWPTWEKTLGLHRIAKANTAGTDYGGIMVERYAIALDLIAAHPGKNVVMAEGDTLWNSSPLHYFTSGHSLYARCWTPTKPEPIDGPTKPRQWPHVAQDFVLMFRADDYAEMFFRLCQALYKDCKDGSYGYWQRFDSRSNGVHSENVMEIALQVVDRSRFRPIIENIFDPSFFLSHYPTWQGPAQAREKVERSGVVPWMKAQGLYDTFRQLTGREEFWTRP